MRAYLLSGMTPCRVPKNSRASVGASKMRSDGTGSRDCMDLGDFAIINATTFCREFNEGALQLHFLR